MHMLKIDFNYGVPGIVQFGGKKLLKFDTAHRSINLIDSLLQLHLRGLEVMHPNIVLRRFATLVYG